jgi:hypothetical protein
MRNALRREIRVLRVLTASSLLFTAGFALTAFRGPGNRARFEEIDVERINIVERDGRVRLVIANLEKTPGPIERGVPFGYGSGTRAGMIFYNDEHTENGGLIFAGRRDSTGRYSAFGSLTFDQYDQDQTVALQYVDENGHRRSGLAINDYALGMSSGQLDIRIKAARAIRDSAARADSMRRLRPFFPKERLYVGRTRDGASQLILSDGAGKARLRLRVDSAGPARIEFLDDSGHVARAIPETSEIRR